MLTEKDYCDYDTCVALKKLGYKVPTSAFYMPNNETLHFVSNPYRGGYVIDCFRSHNSLREDVMTHDFIDAPTMWEAQKWLREEKQIEIVVHSFDYVGEPYFADIHMYREVRCACNYATSYEEALLEGIKEAIKKIYTDVT